MRYGLDRGAENDLRRATDLALKTAARIATNAITGFSVTPTAAAFGITIKFTLASNAGIATVILRRNSTLDAGSSKVVQSWSDLASGSKVTWDDRAQDLIGQPANYWLELVGASGTTMIGPQSARVSTDNTPPSAIAVFDASHEPESGGIVEIGITFVSGTREPFRFMQNLRI
jgi:hypothetical protein